MDKIHSVVYGECVDETRVVRLTNVGIVTVAMGMLEDDAHTLCNQLNAEAEQADRHAYDRQFYA